VFAGFASGWSGGDGDGELGVKEKADSSPCSERRTGFGMTNFQWVRVGGKEKPKSTGRNACATVADAKFGQYKSGFLTASKDEGVWNDGLVRLVVLKRCLVKRSLDFVDMGRSGAAPLRG